ncbi:unannotated protein [freshwater metagenome]|uniref:Unannotated protein n=1 Tax=freshwater metagenome TaxID=449393 RepID=A0A6J6PPI4_9ZZZZ
MRLALGGAVGLAGTFVTLRRKRRRVIDAPVGLAAFESAPCFAELVEGQLGADSEIGSLNAE